MGLSYSHSLYVIVLWVWVFVHFSACLIVVWVGVFFSFLCMLNNCTSVSFNSCLFMVLFSDIKCYRPNDNFGMACMYALRENKINWNVLTTWVCYKTCV